MVCFDIGDVRLTRVPYFDVALPADVIGFTGTQVAAVPWGTPRWSTPEGQVLVGQALWVIESDTEKVVVDPCGAADAFIRSGPEAREHQAAVLAALSSAGLPAETIDSVVLSHLDGIGMSAAVDPEGAWAPLFPNARVVMSQAELAYVASHPEVQGAAALQCLIDQRVVDGVLPPCSVAPGVMMHLTGGHTPGHTVLRIGEGAVFVGHLAINPLQASAGIMRGQHCDPDGALVALERELAWACERDALMIGPLWPSPGAARVTGPPWSIAAA
jgi:glyoxylase-like metal-dependent hydrolase (beta-lactamase superfamily II)